MNIDELIEKYKLNKDMTIKALENIKQNKVKLFGVSGKMGSGKDTVGELVSNMLIADGFEVIPYSYSKPLRDEMNAVRDSYVNHGIYYTQGYFNTPAETIKQLVHWMGNQNAYDRSPTLRLAIQYWGSDVRRIQNKNYWVNKTAQYIVEQLSNGKSVYITDVRQHNEADCIIDLLGTLVRIDVDETERIRRIVARDGFAPNEKQLTHSSETAVDDYVFEHVIDGTRTPKQIADEVYELIAR